MVRDPSVDNNNLDNDSFYLSKPLRANFQINFNKIMSNFNLTTTTTTGTTNQDDFTFLQPFQAQRLERTFNNLKSLKNKFTSTVRSQPYTLTKPTKLNNNNDSNNDLLQKTSKSNNNLILAKVNSMSLTLKKMFTKGKNGGKIDISLLKSKKTNESEKTNNKSLNNSDQENQQQQQQEKQYLKKDESVNDYLMKLSTNQATTTTTSSALFEDNSYLNERIKKLSKEYDDLIKTNKQHQEQQNKYIKNYGQINDSLSVSSIQSNVLNIKDKLPKWTCMVCLHKNRDPYDAYCSICGSSKTSSSNRSYASSNSSSITKPSLAISNKLTKETLFQKNQLSSSLISPPSSDIMPVRKVAKSWKCQNCDYANDNLKIVCVNCRTPKNEVKVDLKDHPLGFSPQVKRKGQLDTASVASSHSSTCSSSYCGSNSTITITKQPQGTTTATTLTTTNNDLLEITQPLSKKSKDSCPQLCSNCNQSISKELTLKEKNILLDSVTPTKPANLLNFDLKTTTTTTSTSLASASSVFIGNISEQKPTQSESSANKLPLAALFDKKGKWNCKTCLVENSGDKDKCACCETPKDDTAAKKPAETPNTTSTASSLSNLFNKGNKWNCKTCLVDNTNDKDKCACCETPRDSSGSKSDTSSLAFGDPFKSKGISLGLPANKTGDAPKFGLQETNPSKPFVFNTTSFTLPSNTTQNSTTTSAFPNNVSKTPSLVSVPTIVYDQSSTSKSINATNNSSESTNNSGSKFTFGPTTTTTSAFPAFGQTTKLQIGDSNTDKKNENNKTTTSSASPAKVSFFGIGSNNNSDNAGLAFNKPTFQNTTKTNTDSTTTTTPQTNNLFPSFNKSENEASKPQTGGFFSSTFPSTTQASTASTTNSSFGSLFGPGFNNTSSNNTTTSTATTATTTTTTTNSTSSIFGTNSTPSIFGSNTTAATTTSNATPSIFGSNTTTSSSTNAFSSTNTNSTNSLFGFGSNKSGGLFGNQTTNTTSSIFNAPTTTTTTSAPTLFGSNTLTTTSNSNPFSTSTTTANPSTFGFGSSTPFGMSNSSTNPTAPATTTAPVSTSSNTTSTFGVFNATNTNSNNNDPFKNPTTTNSIFNTAKPTSQFTFGANNSSTLPTSHSAPSFSLTNTSNNNNNNTGNSATTNAFTAFGSNQTNNPPSIFGNITTDASKPSQQSGSVFAFGQQQPLATPAPTNSPFTFGSTTSSANQSTNEHQGHKRTNDQQPQQQSTGFNFNQSTGFNFSTQPNINFTSTSTSTPNQSFGTFVFGDQSTTNGQQTPRLIKKPTRKLTKK